MKELTIEQKAEAYDEAIKRAEKWRNAPNVDKIPTFANRVIDDIFPELPESEDERIRQRIIHALHGDVLEMSEIKEAIAWLEKKGEQKPVDKVEPKFKVDDVMRTKQEAADNITSGLPVIVSIDEEYYHCNNELIAIKNQDDYEYPPMNRKHNSAWSEEDKEMLDLLIANYKFLCKEFRDKEHDFFVGMGLVEEDLEMVNWLKYLKDRVQPQMQWKAVDKEIYVKEPALAQRKDKSEPNHGYVICYDHTLTPDVYERFIMISDIYNQSHWKPSDEQMKVLDVAIMNSHLTTAEYDGLVKLKEQLKKL